MKRFLKAGLVLASLMAVPAYSAEITDETTCQAEIGIIEKLDDDTDVGLKFEVIVKELIEVLEHLCETKAFGDAEEVAGAIHGILATGERDDRPKKT